MVDSKETLSHCLFGGIETKKQSFNCYEFTVASLDNEFQCKITALDKSTICGYIPRLNTNHELFQELKKHNIALSDVGEEATPTIGLLIGADYAGFLLTDSFIRLNNNLVAMKNKFGWTLQGPIMNACSVMTNVVSANLQLSELWDLETLGIRDPAEVASKTKSDSIIMDQFRNSIKINNEGRYEVDLPWKPNHGELLDNKQLAERRLMSTTQRLLKLNEFDNYCQVFEDWLKEGVIEEVNDTARPKHYLSHHAVIKSSSLTTRVRPVFDASARDRNGNSLNSFLEKGINCLELIPNLLIKFRKYAIGITSDIKKAFLQISLNDEDRRYLSFLWWKNNERKDLITYHHRRVVFGVTSSPFLLGATINYHLEKYTEKYKDTAERLKNSFYVDNCVTSLESEQEAQIFIEEAKRLMLEAKFDLRGWVTAPMTNKDMTSKEDSLSRQSVKHADTPLPPLPLDRIKPAAAFEVTGIDLAGPLFLRSGGKVWIILFTCAVYRAVHLELTKSLSTEAFLMALRRFIARRGRVNTIYTDNGTNFHGADNLLKALNWEEIAAYSSVRSIKWKFNPPAAPWWGGWWERLIRSLKELLRRNLGQKTVTYEELSTILCDCEALMNSRPLTYIADNSENLKPLTPACFVQGLPASETPDLDQLDHDSLNRRLRYLHKLRGDLRERFRNEYLGMLIQKGKERDSNIKVGDVVLVETDAKRIKWPLGVILEVYTGKDGNARVARVRTADGEYTRAYQRLYPLEVQPDEVL
ncbi:uncharacterized protein [Choristoneura fumiferana]|uniref:uncharacterized protein n=1 Tax=Choristoneura fumiferana TaxID=7141 RepID=UPI003D15626E